MAYGQKNYADWQGIPPQRYRISQIGCFLTSFCNLLERFGRGLPPNQLNNIFINRGIYIDVDDGVRDDLGWQSVVAYDGHVALQKTGTGIPPHKNSIVRIKATNSFGTHFCLVDRIEGSTVYIVDSWDGAVKNSNVYGPITGWAAYGDIKPQPVQPIGEPKMTPDQERNAYRIVLNRAMEHAGSGRTGYQFITAAEAELKAQRTAVQNIQNSLNQKITEMQNVINSLSVRPTKEEYAKVQAQVNDRLLEIADLQKKLTEAENKPPVEVVKEVQVERFPTWVPEWIKQLLERIFK